MLLNQKKYYILHHEVLSLRFCEQIVLFVWIYLWKYISIYLFILYLFKQILETPKTSQIEM